MSSSAYPREVGGRGQGGPYSDSPSAPLRFPSGSPAAPSELVQRNCSPPEAGGPVGRAELGGKWGPGTVSGVVNSEVQCLQGSGLAWRLVIWEALCRVSGGLKLSSWEGCWGLGAVVGSCSHCCPAWCLRPRPQASALCSTGSAALCFVAVFLRHAPQLLPRPVAFSKSRQDSVSPVVQMLGPTAVSACAVRDGAVRGSPRV